MVRVGERLAQERIQKGLSIEEVATATKIRPSFITAIERGDYKTLPSSAYIQGFIRNYAEFLGLPAKEYTALFRREFNAKEHLDVLPKGMAAEEPVPLKRRKIGQTVFIALTIFITLFGYLLYQYRYAIIYPPLAVLSPKENTTVAQQVVVSGTTDPNASVYVNNALAAIDPSGEFRKQIILFPGKTTIRVTARNRLGKETTVERKVDVQADK